MGSAMGTLTTSAKLGCSTLVPSEAHACWWVGLQDCPCLLRPSQPAGLAGSMPAGSSPTTANSKLRAGPKLAGLQPGPRGPSAHVGGNRRLGLLAKGHPDPGHAARLSLAWDKSLALSWPGYFTGNRK